MEVIGAKDNLGNQLKVGDTVIIAVRSGRNAALGRAFVKGVNMRSQFGDGTPIPMVDIEWSNINRFWLPARNVIKLLPEMLPENARKKYDDIQEGIKKSGS